MKTIKTWFQNSRPISLPQSLMPALVACFLAAKYADFKWYLALFGLIGVCFAHLSLNLFDDLFDYLNADQGERVVFARAGMRARTVKCPTLLDGTHNVWQWLLASCIFGAIACAFGVPILIMRGWKILIVVAIVFVLGIFYSAKPLKLSYNGFGELIIGIIFGPLITIGVCYGASGEFHAGDVLIGICLGLFVVNILYVHSIMDYDADLGSGKRTLAWLVHGETNKYIALIIICFVPYILVIIGVICNWLSPWFFLGFITLPWSIDLVISMLKFKKEPFGKVVKKKWYGNFRDWDQICAVGFDWFMLRWFLAQKIDSVFAILSIVSVVLVIIFAV